MQQPKQQRTYADLYSQQRSASGSPVSPGGHRSTASSLNGRSAAAAAAAEPAATEPGRLQADTGATTTRPHSSPKASPRAGPPAVLTAHQKPSRIPMHPGQAHSPRAVAPSQGGRPAAGKKSSVHTSTFVVSPEATADAPATLSPSNGAVATAGGSASEAAADQAPQQHTAVLAASPAWSQGSTSSSDVSSSSPTRSSSKHGSKAQDSSMQGDSGDEHCCRNGSLQQEQHQQGNGLHVPAQQQDGGSVPELPGDLQRQQNEQRAAGGQLEQQEQRLQQTEQQSGQPPQQQRQQQQPAGSHVSGSPGPPDSSAAGQTAAAAAVAAAAAATGVRESEASCSSGAALDSNAVQARMSADPDYELPQGKLTETQVLLEHGSKLRLDRYGFILGESDMAGHTAGAAAAPRKQRSASQVQREQRRVAKWRHMLGSSAADFEAYFAAKMSKVKKRVRKGIPDEFRGYVWQLLSGGHALMRSQPGAYARLLSHAPDAVDLEIMRDLNRTFPNHVFFTQRQGPGQQSLFHVLRAYSALDKQVGYVQGMGFVTAILLMYMSEEAAFWTLVAQLKGTSRHSPLEGLYQAGMPLLQQCLFQFHELLKQEHPRLGRHLEQEGVVPSMYCTHWFNTLFAYSLPFEQLLRVWDVFLLEGMKMVFRVGIALLASAQEQLCAMPFERLVAALNGRKFPILNKQPDALIKAALRIPVSRQLQQLRERFLALQAEAQAAAAAGAAAAGADGQSAAAAGGGAATSGGVGRSGASYSSKSSAAHAQQQLVAGLVPVPMGPNS